LFCSSVQVFSWVRNIKGYWSGLVFIKINLANICICKI
jgi:hypothetical protein